MDFRSEIGLCEDEIDYIKNLVIKKMKAVIEIVIYSIKYYLFSHQTPSLNFFCSDDNTFVKLFSLTISIRFNASGFAEPKCLKHENNHVTKDCKKYRNQLELIITAWQCNNLRNVSKEIKPEQKRKRK
ncbi:hypothetical protein HZH66_013982 [Vespula vulgaris]|uniref:Uncharacterized protein n=1 Tax=Vespula vulgaris TaxID=7454 RepID=A0A834MSQ8_VESVU|nr:hypothetical protein HZH66_013982 [Vespula vulgaris]